MRGGGIDRIILFKILVSREIKLSAKSKNELIQQFFKQYNYSNFLQRITKTT